MHNRTVDDKWWAGAGVSSREAEVLAALEEHLTNAEIADRLFISVRTVESHVSSLLRKLRVDDRRGLVAVAAARRNRAAMATARGSPAAIAGDGRFPAPLTSFVGRVGERAALIDALGAHRLVTAVGPGGVGKTRLAQTVAADLAERFADGAWFVDLVPVSDPSMVAPAIAAVLGLGEYRGRSAEDTVIGWLAPRESLLVLDNCEHLLNGVVVLLERLLASCPRLSVLTTSRARLLVPFEWVFPVPGLFVDVDGGGDAVELFRVRAAAAGSPLTTGDSERLAAICLGLDGMALAIELAAARVASLGLDGIEAGLADRLRLLTGGPRVDDRHRSLRSALDWSYALLDEASQSVLRRVCVFAAPFTAAAAADVLTCWPPVESSAVSGILAGLAEQSLLVAIADPAGTQYRVLETIRQYGADRLAAGGESVEAQSRHLRWCLDAAAALASPRGGGNAGAWRAAFDRVADELRSALGWAASEAQSRTEAHRLAVMLGDLSFARGLPGESQRRYEQAADLAADAKSAAVALHLAAGAAESRAFGNEAMRLHRAAADAAIRAGDRAAAAINLARAAELVNRAPGMMTTLPAAGEVDALLAEASQLAAGDLAAEARTILAEEFKYDETDPVAAELIERALALARRAGDPLTESAALDSLTAVQLAAGEVRAAAASTLRRIELLAPLPMTAAAGIEFSDAYAMATDCAVASGDLRAARVLAGRYRDLPYHREEAHLYVSRLILVTALAGDWNETLALTERFREGWDRAGQPRIGNLTRAAYAAATVHGLCGNDDTRDTWLEIVDALATPGHPVPQDRFGEFFDAMLLLHRGQTDIAVRLLDTPPEQFRTWASGLWRPWYAALWAEAAVVAGHPDADGRIRRARLMTRDNPIATAIVDRAAALASGGDGMFPAAAALAAAGCRYQWARTLVLIGGAERLRGEAALAAMGATAMVWPPG